MKGKIMSKTHNVTSLPKDANKAAVDEGDISPTLKTRVKNGLHKQKKFLIGVGTGAVAAVALAAALRKADSDEEETEETPED